MRKPELPSFLDKDFSWPTLEEISAIQQEQSSGRPPTLFLQDAVWVNPNGAIWIPDSATDLQLRLRIIAYTGLAGHTGASATEMAPHKRYFWSNLLTDIRSFVRACVHCISTVGGVNVHARSDRLYMELLPPISFNLNLSRWKKAKPLRNTFSC